MRCFMCSDGSYDRLGLYLICSSLSNTDVNGPALLAILGNGVSILSTICLNVFVL